MTQIKKYYGADLRIDNVPWEEETWWSAHDKRYADYDPWAEFEQPAGSHLVIELHAHRFLKTTPQGVWLAERGWNKRFLNLGWTKQWASPTQHKALEHLIARKEKHVRMCKARLQEAEQHLDAAVYYEGVFRDS